MRFPLFRILIVILVGSAFFPASLAALRVAIDDNYPPYSFRDAGGNHEGIFVDQWKLWSTKTGEPVEFLPLPWSEALRALDEGQADVLDTVFETPARDEKWLFSSPSAEIESSVFARNGLAGFDDVRDLKGYQVGVKKDDAAIEGLRSAGITGFKEYEDYGSLIDAADRGDVLVFLMDLPPARHLLIQKGLESRFHKTLIVSRNQFRRAVLRGHEATLFLVNRGFARITDDEHAAIDRQWLGSPVDDPSMARSTLIILGVVIAALGVLLGLVLLFRRQSKTRLGQLRGTEDELRTTQARAEAILHGLPDLLFITDRLGVIVEARPPQGPSVFQNLDGYIGQTVWSLFPGPHQPEGILQAQKALAAEGRASLQHTVEVRGVPRTFDARIVQLADESLVALIRDVSDSRRAWEADLHRNRLESLGILAGGLAHDFNNSLGVIQGFISLARVQLSNPEKALKSLDKAVQATRRAAGLTAQLRVLAQGGEVHRRAFDLRALAEEAASFAVVGSPCVVSFEVGEGPWIVEADPDQVTQVFHNLVLNAVQAMPRGGRVTLVFRRSADNQLVVAVADEGVGIPADALPRIFDPYFTTKSEGTGLGLAVVHAVVTRHHGTIEVDSRPGRGTVMTVSFPASSAPVPVSEVSSAPVGPVLQGHRVLIMEDEPELRDLMAEVARTLGLEPVLSRNGAEGVAAFDAAALSGAPFDLVISDLLVPGSMGGREMITILRSRPVRFRALAVTGFSTERSVEDFQKQGFDVILGKPFTVDELRERVIELMKAPWKTGSST